MSRELIAEVERLLCAHESAIRQHDRGAEWDEAPSATRAALLDAVRAIAAERDHFRDAAKLVSAAPQPVGEVQFPMPDKTLYGSDRTVSGHFFTAAKVRTYGDARHQQGYAAGVAAGEKDAERYRAGMREMIDCRTCRNHTRDGCIQTALCVDADGYRRALPVRFWVATHSAALAEGDAG